MNPVTIFITYTRIRSVPNIGRIDKGYQRPRSCGSTAVTTGPNKFPNRSIIPMLDAMFLISSNDMRRCRSFMIAPYSCENCKGSAMSPRTATTKINRYKTRSANENVTQRRRGNKVNPLILIVNLFYKNLRYKTII